MTKWHAQGQRLEVIFLTRLKLRTSCTHKQSKDLHFGTSPRIGAATACVCVCVRVLAAKPQHSQQLCRLSYSCHQCPCSEFSGKRPPLPKLWQRPPNPNRRGQVHEVSVRKLRPPNPDRRRGQVHEVSVRKLWPPNPDRRQGQVHEVSVLKLWPPNPNRRRGQVQHVHEVRGVLASLRRPHRAVRPPLPVAGWTCPRR